MPTWLVFAGGLAAFAGGFLPPVSQSLAARTQTPQAPQTTPPPATAAGTAAPRQSTPPEGRGRGNGQRPGGPGWFWQDGTLKKQIGLTETQANRMEAFYQRTTKDTASVWDEYQEQNSDLDAAVRDRKISREDLQLKIVMVESLRSKLNESRTLTFYRIDLMLTPDQFKKLQAFRDAHPRPAYHGDRPWWKDDAKRLGLSDQTSADIDRIYQQRQKQLGPLLATLQQAQADVDAIRHTRSATPEQLEPKVVTLETLRSRLNETRIVMLYQFSQKLTPDQYARLQQLVEEQRGGRRGGGSGSRP